MNVEKALRQFVRTQLGARVSKDEEGKFQSKVKGKTGQVTIQNPATVEANLDEQCGKPIKETGNSKSYKFKTGKGKADFATVTVTHGKDRGGVLKVEGLAFGE